MIIGVIGGEQTDDGYRQLAYDVGYALAERGHLLVCGGRGGVMREACRGAKAAGGTTIGILPGDDLRDANEFLDIPIITGIGFARNTIIARTAHALIAIDGAYGTLSEIAFALLDRKPVIGLRTWELRDGAGVEVPIVRVEGAREAVLACERLAAPHP